MSMWNRFVETMSSLSALNFVYLVSAVLFIFALKRLSSPRTARTGNLLGALGMLLAVIVTLMSQQIISFTWVIVGLVIGTIVGASLALAVKMTAMPQMVGLLNGFGGLASAMVVIWEFYRHRLVGDEHVFAVIAAITSLIGWVTFSGSMVAFAKLQDLLSSRPIQFPLHRVVNVLLMLASVTLVVVVGVYPAYQWVLIVLIVLSLGLGVSLVIPIGGADMPVVISLLNSYSGLAASAAGFLLGNPGLIIAGALVGASGIVLTRLMCKAMNRSLLNVLFGGFGTVAPSEKGEAKTVRRYTLEDVQIAVEEAQEIVIIPGYGLAAAQAQYAVRELADYLEQKGAKVRFAIHPVAGRMPGHMNVLLAEADVPYDHLLDLDAGNREIEHADVVVVVGANDVVNPLALTDKQSPIYGMPIFDVRRVDTVIISKRSLAAGFSGIDNPLFYQDNTMMIFGDSKDTFTSLVSMMKES